VNFEGGAGWQLIHSGSYTTAWDTTAEDRALASKITKRGEDTFFGAMNDYLKRYYTFAVG
jgi:hypothetical protein